MKHQWKYRTNTWLAAVVAISFGLTTPALASGHSPCTYDAGASDDAIGLNQSGVIAWAQRYDNTCSSAIGTIWTTYGGTPFPGTAGVSHGDPVGYGIFEDTGSGPGNAIWQGQDTVDGASINSNTFQMLEVSPEQSVPASFYLVVWVEDPGSSAFPGPRDTTSAPGHAADVWVMFTIGFTFANFDPENPDTVLNMANSGFPSVWMLRGGPAPVPCTGQQDFLNDYDPANWSVVNDPPGNDGTATFTTSTLQIIGGNNGTSNADTMVTITIPGDGTWEFDWFYDSTDVAQWDWGGYVHNGVQTILAFNQDGPISGSESIPVSAGDEIGWFVGTEDGQFGPGVLDISNFCAPAAAPGPTTLSLNPNPTACYQVGDTVTVNIDMSDAQDIIVGGQFFLQYDNTLLQFISAVPGNVPFTLEIFSAHVSPFIDYAVGVDPPPTPQGTDQDTTMAVLTFEALQEVCASDPSVHPLVWFRPHVPPTRLTDEFGQEVLPLDMDDLDAITIDSTPPVVSAPSDVVVDCTDGYLYGPSGDCAGICGGQSTAGCWCDNACVGFGDCCDGACTDCPGITGCAGMATATDNCDPNPDVSFTDNAIAGICPQEFVIERTWTATDCSGNSTSDMQIIDVQDNTAPTVSGVPSNIVVYSDAGVCGASVTWTPPTASDNCTDTADIVVSSTHDPGDFFNVGITSVSYSFTDECGNTAKVNFDVEVLPLSELVVDFSLQGVVSGPFTRCIEFELTDANGNVIETVEATLTFVNGQALATVDVPCGAYGGCIMARDPLHTLRSTGDLAIVGTEYDAFNFVDLRGGDLNDDGVIDILDFGLYVFTSVNDANPGANTDCTIVGPHGDITGNGLVEAADFTFISTQFLQMDDVCPITLMAGRHGAFVSPIATPQPRRSITVRELHAKGLGHLAVADLNNDGVVDEQDIALFLAGVRP